MAPRTFKPPRPSASVATARSTADDSRLSRTALDDSSSSAPSDSDAAPATSAAPRRRSANPAPEPAPEQAHLLPAPLLTRIVQEHFEQPDTKLGREATVLLGKYVDTFVREALARARHEMELKKGAGTRDFLEVEDLEKLAPQLLLDF